MTANNFIFLPCVYDQCPNNKMSHIDGNIMEYFQQMTHSIGALENIVPPKRAPVRID